MKRQPPRYVTRNVARGRVYYRFRKGGVSCQLPGEPGEPEFERAYLRALDGSDPVPTARNFRALVASYRRSPRFRGLASRTLLDYDKVLTWVEATLGPLPVDRMQRKDVIRARDTNADRTRAANYIVQVLRVLFEHAIDQGWRQENPAKGVRLLKSDRPPREAWPADKIEAFRAAADGRALLVFDLCLGTGQRIGDVLRMRWDDIAGGAIRVRQGKTGADLWIPLTPRLQAALAATRRAGLTICAQPNGRPTSYRGAADLVMAVRRQIGAEAFDLHGLRYAAAEELAAAGCSDDEIAAITGHKSRAMVARYAGPARQKARALKAQEKRG